MARAEEHAIVVARGASYVFLQSLTSIVTGVLYFALLARLVTKSEMGWYTGLSFLLALLPLLGTLGMSPTATSFISEHLGEGKPDKARRVPQTALLICLLSSLTLFSVCFIGASFLSVSMKMDGQALLLQVFAMDIPLAALFMILSASLQGLQEIKKLSGLTFVNQIVGRTVGLTLLWSGLGLVGVVIGWILGSLLSLFVALIIVFSRLPPTKGFYSIGTLLSFSTPLLSSSVLLILSRWIDRALVILYVEPAEIGVYNVAATAWTALIIVPMAIQTALFPKMSELHARHGVAVMEKALKSTSRYMNLIHIPTCFGIILLAPSLIPLFASVKFTQAVVPYMVMALGAVPYGYTMLAYSTLLVLKKNKQVFAYAVLGILTDITVCYFLIPSLGILGAAIGNASLQVVSCLLALLFLRKYVHLRTDRETILKVPIAAIPMGLAVYLSQRAFPIHAFLPLHVVLGFFIYTAVILHLKTVHESDFQLLEKFLPNQLQWAPEVLRKMAKKL